MTALPVLDLVAGLIFIYLLLSIINNSLFEIIIAVMKSRAKMLKVWLDETLTPSTAQKLMNHPLLNGASKPNKSTTYMDSKCFASAIIETILTASENAKKGDAKQDIAIPLIEKINSGIDNAELPAELKSVLRLFVAKTKSSIDANKLLTNPEMIEEIKHLESQIANWFDSIMERLTGKFKRKSLFFTFIFGTIITCLLNIDSISLMNYLYNNPEARQKLAVASYNSTDEGSDMNKKIESIKNKAAKSVDSSTVDSLSQIITKIKNEKASIDTTLASLNSLIPIGWKEAEYKELNKGGIGSWSTKIGGLIMTILALCLGAPFWFDILNKVANLRSSLKPQTAEQKDSKAG